MIECIRAFQMMLTSLLVIMPFKNYNNKCTCALTWNSGFQELYHQL